MSPTVKWRRIGLALSDALLVSMSLWIAYLIRRDFQPFRQDRNQYVVVVGVFIVVRLCLFAAFNLYRGIPRYAGPGEMLATIAATVLGSAVLTLLNFWYTLLPPVPWLWTIDLANGAQRLERVPLSVLAIECLLTIMVIAASRFSRRIIVTQLLYPTDETGTTTKRLLVVGAGNAGEAIVRQMISSGVRRWKPVAFVDDDVDKQNFRIHGLPVAGTIADMAAVIHRTRAEEVLIALPNVPPSRLREIVALCENAKVQFRILPSVQDVMTGRVSIKEIRPVEIEDLLGRDPVTLELPDERNYVRDQVVMITGAGGSIGSELCRQLLQFHPQRILLFGHGENSIYDISQELSGPASDARSRDVVIPIIGDIRDYRKLCAVVEEFKPTIFFHAAAHKHVPLMELHPDEAIKNNVTGTRNVARAADQGGAKRFILISSDKAVRPTNVMGASKRIAEMIVFSMARKSRTQFVAVRFGNVLGSRGSVVPLFRRQIANGGPVTLTHPEVVRFFMTIPEAVSLVIQAGSLDEQRRLYLLDMGQPVRIVDLARNLIRLCGYEPDKEIPIVFTGLRPGEKLKEELLTAGENVKATDMGKIFTTEPEVVDDGVMEAAIAELERLADAHDADAIRAKLRDLVPDYGPEHIAPA
ncbi:MAG: polysaccharide biosynthesis protein [Candidatus Sumerlaeaceae bacterium]